MTMVDTDANFEKDAVQNEIMGFRNLVKSASQTAENLTPDDLPAAFQLSFGLMERISDLMLETFAFFNSTSQNRPERVCSDDSDRRSSPLIRNGISAKLEINSLQKEDKYQAHYNKDSTEVEQYDGQLCKERVWSGSEKFSPVELERDHNVRSPVIENQLTVDMPNDGTFTSMNETDTTKTGAVPHEEQHFSSNKRGQTESVDVQEYNKKFIRSYDSFGSQPTNGRDSVDQNWTLNPRLSSDVRRWRLTSTDRLNSLIDECERQVNGRKLYVCKFCGKVYEIKSSMRYHMKIIHLQMHLKTTEMQCRICGKQFTCVSAVNRHQAKCILSSYQEPNPHRMKNSLSSPSTTLAETNCSRRVSRTCSDVPYGPMLEADVSNALNINQPITGNFFNGLFSKKSLNQSPSATINGFQESMLPGLFSSNTYNPFDEQGNQNVPERAFSPLHPLSSDQLTDVDVSRNRVSCPWSTFPRLNGAISELTPLQLELCMKAVVQGFHSRTHNFVGTQELITESKSELLSGSRTSTTSRPSLSSIYTPSDTSELEASQTLENDDVAIDLSARSGSDSVMIETF